jgi:hypothetical protein
MLAVNGPVFLGSVSPAATADRLYNNGGSLYWAGSPIAGGSVGNWTTDGTNVWRTGGYVGIGTTTPGSLLSLGSVANLGTATSTFYATGGINLTAGCFAVNGTCVGGSNGSGTVGSGSQGQFAFYNAAGTTLTATSSLTVSQSGNIGIGTTSPSSALSVAGDINASGYYRYGGSILLDASSTLGNTFLGLGAGNLTATSSDNVAVGANAGAALTGQTAGGNTFLGYDAGESVTCGYGHTFLGAGAGQSFTGASGCPYPENGLNTFIGLNAGQRATGNSIDNVFIGEEAGGVATSPSTDVFIGNHAGSSVVSPTFTIAIGDEALGNSDFSGSADNIAIGSHTGQNATGAANILIGDNVAGGSSFTGYRNAIIGVGGAQSLTTGAQNTLLGYQAG